MFSPRLFLRSFRNAWRGLCDIAQTEQSFRIQMVCGIGVGILASILPLDTWERILLFLLIMGVLVLEIVNSIFERLADAVHPRLHPTVREIKDMMAGAVLLAACTAAVVGGIILFPHIFAYFCGYTPMSTWGSLCTW